MCETVFWYNMNFKLKCIIHSEISNFILDHLERGEKWQVEVFTKPWHEGKFMIFVYWVWYLVNTDQSVYRRGVAFWGNKLEEARFRSGQPLFRSKSIKISNFRFFWTRKFNKNFALPKQARLIAHSSTRSEFYCTKCK